MKNTRDNSDSTSKKTSEINEAPVQISPKNLSPLHVDVNSYDDNTIFSKTGSFKSEFTIDNLLYTSEFFLNKAHLIVLDANDIVGTKTYYKMIKLSIKALLLIVKKYSLCLNPQLELIIYFKLARLYLNETENLNRADDYINKAITIASRNNLIKMKFISEFLAGRILEKTNSKLLPNYLNEKIKRYKSSGYNNLSDLLLLSKINSLLVSDYSTGLIVLQSLIIDPTVDSTISILSQLFAASLILYRGSPSNCQSLLSKVETTLESVNGIPPQIIAMKLLLQFQLYIQTNEVSQSSSAQKQINSFINGQRSIQWKSWNESGSFVLETSPSSSHPTTTHGDTIPYQIFWLNSDEFVITFYFLTGVHLLSELQNLKKANKVFTVCLGLINSQLEELTKIKDSKRNFPVSQLTNKIIRLNYTKIFIQYYQVWLQFTNNDFSGTGPLQEFLDNYNANNFTEEEICYYKLLVPKILYLFGVYSQFHGDLKAAKHYYLKVRNATKCHSTKSATIASLQFNSGIGGETFQAEKEYSELYVYSTIHLLMISNYELAKFSKIPKEEQDNNRINEAHRFIATLYQDLSEAFNTKNKLTSNTFTMNFTMSNKLLLLTYQAILSIYSSSNVTESDRGEINDSLHFKMKENLQEFEIPQGMRYIKPLVLYVLYLGSVNLEERNKYFSVCMELIADITTDNEKVLSLFVLRDSNKINLENNDQDKFKMTNLQIQVLKQEVENKFSKASHAI